MAKNLTKIGNFADKMKIDKMKRLITFLVIYCSVLNIWADKVVFRAEAPDAVVQGDQFRLTYTVNSLRVSDFRAPSIKGFDVLMGPSQSTQIYRQTINGQVSDDQQITFTYILMANETGNFQIPGASVEVSGQKYTSNSLRIKVLPPNSNTGSSRQHPNANTVVPGSSSGSISSGSLFMRVIPSKTTVHEQEAILLTYKIYTTVDLQQLDGDMPDLTGFHTQEIPSSTTKKWSLERYNGTNYKTVVWRQYVLFPQQTGTLEVPSVTYEGTIRVMTGDMDDPFASLMNGGGFDYVKKKIVAPKVSIRVLPLSAKPTDFSGGVGKFNITASVNSNQVLTNDAITLKVVISGNGNLKLINTPTVQFPVDFEVYDPKATNEIKATTQGVEGKKTIEYLAVPRTPGDYKIPPVKLVYYDVDANTYKTIETQAFDIHVKKGNGNASQVIADFTNKESIKVLGNDVRFIKLGKTSYRPIGKVIFGTTGYWMGYLLPLLLFIGVSVAFRQRAVTNANISAAKQKKANKMALKRMKEAQKRLVDNQQAAFYDELLKALWGYVSDKLSMPVASLSKDNVASALQAKGVDSQVIDAFLNILNDCEFARYAPGNQNEAMDKAYTASLDVITKIENCIKK